MQWPKLLILALMPLGNALLRFQCSQLVTQRLDPLVNPGMLPSPHVHQIVGGVSKYFMVDPRSGLIWNRTHLMSQWIPQRTCQLHRLVQAAPLVKTSPTTGRRSSISGQGMALTNASRKCLRSPGLRGVLPYAFWAPSFPISDTIGGILAFREPWFIRVIYEDTPERPEPPKISRLGNTDCLLLKVYYMSDALYDTAQKSKVTAFKPVSHEI